MIRKVFSLISLVIVVGLVSLASFRPTWGQEATAAQGLEISPPLVEVSTDPGKTETFEIRLRNITNSDLIARANVNDFAARGEDGQPAVILDDSEPYPYSLKDWVTDIPALRLAPQEQGTIKVTLNVPEDASPGGHYGVIRFTALPPELDDNGVSLSASLGTLVLANVSGETTEKMSVEEFFVSRNDARGSFFEYGPLTFSERLKNEGSVHLKPTGNIEIKNMLGRSVATLAVNEDQRNILPASIRKFDQSINKKWWFGRYTATLNLTYGDGQQAQTVINFWVIPYKLVAVVLTGLLLLVLLIILLSRRYHRRVLKQAQAEVAKNNSAAGNSTSDDVELPEAPALPTVESTPKRPIAISSDSPNKKSKDNGSSGPSA